MARDVFVSHAEEDEGTALALAKELRLFGVSTWTYEEEGVPGISYLTQIDAAISACRAFVLIASSRSVNNHQVIREVEQAHERQKMIIASRVEMTHQQFLESNPILRMACGTAVTLPTTIANVAGVAKRIAGALADSSPPLETPRTPRGSSDADTGREPAIERRAVSTTSTRNAWLRRRTVLIALFLLSAAVALAVELLYRPAAVTAPHTIRLTSKQTLRGYGFYTPRGYIVTDRIPFERERVLTAESTDTSELPVEVELVRLSDSIPVALAHPVRGSRTNNYAFSPRPTGTLHIGEFIQLYRGPNYATAGTVLALGVQETLAGAHGSEVLKNLLRTTNVSVAGDSGAPILDRQQRVVAMLYGGSSETSLAVGIEQIMSEFPEAF